MDDVHKFASEILQSEPKPPNSISLYIDTGGDDAATFEVLLTIMTDLIKEWYKPPVSLQIVSPENRDKLIAYFASFGYEFDLNIKTIRRNAPPTINNKSYENENQLENMKFQIIDNEKLYTVKFKKL